MTRLRAARTARNLTQADLARLLDCDQSAVSHWERGAARPHRRYRLALEKALGQPISALLQNDDEAPQGLASTVPGPAKDREKVSHGG